MSRALLNTTVCLLVALFCITSTLVPASRAAIIDTQDYLQRSERYGVPEIAALIDREDVQRQLVELGVDPDEARERLNSLTAGELRLLQERMDELPASGSVLAVLGAVLVVLIVLEILGVTNIFTKL